MKTLEQVALQQPPQFACGCLFLLSEVLKARPPLWNMVLQNESIDEDTEHFEDIIEESETKAGISSAEQPRNAIRIVQNSNNGVKTDGYSSDLGGEDRSLASDSEDNSLDGGDGLNNDDELRKLSDFGKDQPQVSNVRSSLPGGYDMRHREPSYWYFPGTSQSLFRTCGASNGCKLVGPEEVEFSHKSPPYVDEKWRGK